MQHTETYNLNLIETSDTFSPDPLNQNAQLLEDALSAETAARQSAVAGLDSRVKVFEAHHVKYGTYYSNKDEPITINLGFQPLILFAHGLNSHYCGIAYRDFNSGKSSGAQITENGFKIASFTMGNGLFNTLNVQYFYIAVD